MGTSTKNVALTQTVTISKAGINYKPKATTAQGNAATWATIQGLLAKPHTVGALTKAVAAKHNHAPFVGYAIRRGWLVVK